MHANLDQISDKKYNEVKTKDLDKLEFDYIALGHIHKRNFDDSMQENIIYPGSTLALGFDEQGKHGIIEGEINNKDLKLKPGMTANVSIITAKNEDVLTVPNIALKFTPKTDGQKYKNQGLWVKDGLKISRINITTGASDDSFTEVNGEGIREGEKILVGIKGKKRQKQQNFRPPRL